MKARGEVNLDTEGKTMQHWTLNFKRKSNVSHERIEALMAEFGFSWQPQEAEAKAALPAESPTEDIALFWPMPEAQRVDPALLLG
jgi:hypothetical protein